MNPPYYILFAHSPLSSSNPGPLSNTLRHPAIQYHYQDDSPLALLPQHPDEHVIVLDYDPDSTSAPAVQSLSKTLVVTGLRIEEAPGAAATDDADVKNDKMYTIEATELEDQYVPESSAVRKITFFFFHSVLCTLLKTTRILPTIH